MPTQAKAEHLLYGVEMAAAVYPPARSIVLPTKRRHVIALGMPFFLALTTCTHKKEKIVARVGEQAITNRDVELRNRVNQVYYPAHAEDVGLTQLIRAFTDVEILKNNHRLIRDAEVLAEAERIQKNTQAPEKLVEIRAIFSEEKDYLRLFVLPVYAGRILMDEAFPISSAQSASRQPAEEFLGQVKAKPTAFKSMAKAKGLLIAHITASEKTGYKEDSRPEELVGKRTVIDPPKPSREMAAHMAAEEAEATRGEAKKWINEVFHGLRPGQIYRLVIDRGELWQVIKYMGENPKGTHHAEAVSFLKADFQAWRSSEAAKIPVHVAN